MAIQTGERPRTIKHEVDPMAVDYSDPCAVLAVLRPAYYELLAGAKAQTVTFAAGNGSQRSVTYYQTSLKELRAEIARLEVQCAAASGGSRRRCVYAGGRW